MLVDIDQQLSRFSWFLNMPVLDNKRVKKSVCLG
jgi:hypothetical protein